MRLRNRPASRFLQRHRIERLDAKAHRAEARRIERVDQLHVETVETRLGLEAKRETARLDRIAQLETPVALLAEQRIAKNDVRPRSLITEPLELVDNVRDGPRAITGQNPVRAIGAVFRAAA